MESHLAGRLVVISPFGLDPEADPLLVIAAALHRIEHSQEEIMTALADLQAADQALQTEVSTFLADVSTALSTALDNGDSAAIEQVVSDINAEVALLQANDPVSGTAATSSSATPAASTVTGSGNTAGAVPPAAPDVPADGAAPVAAAEPGDTASA